MNITPLLSRTESLPPLQPTQHGEMSDENNVSKLFKQTLTAHPAEPAEKVNLTQSRAQASKKGKEPDDGMTSHNITRPVYTLAGNTTSPSPAKTIDDESSFNREKDMQILLEILATLENYEQEGLEVKSVLKRITSLCGGSSGITYKDDNPKCIRNRYGRDKTIEPKGFINFALLHRAFIILEAGIPAPEHIADDFRKLKSKIAYILTKENNQETALFAEGDAEDLKVIYQYVKDNYYDVSIPRIASELDSLRDQTIKNKEDLYFFGRKLIIIGELCHEIEKDIRNIQDDEANSDQLKEIIESFKAINKERNNFVHPRALVKQFLELDQDNKLKSKLYDVILKGLKLIHSPQTKEILKAALGTREISERGVKQKRKAKKEKTLTPVEKKLIKSNEYARLLETCRIIENNSLSTKEQQSIKFGEIPEVDKLINIGNKLNIFSQVNALKMHRVKCVHESNLTDKEYRKCFEAAIENAPFDITSLEDCERVLAKIATLSAKIDWKVREEFTKHPQMPELFSRLRHIFHIYNDSQMPSSAELHQTLSLSAELKGRTWVLHKGVKEEDSFKKLKAFYTKLNKAVKEHDQNIKNEKYSKAVSTATQGIEEFSILRKNCVTSALKTIATQKESAWEAKEKSRTQLVQVLVSSCNTHVIKDPRTLESRIREELKDERTRLTQKIDEEIEFADQIRRDAPESIVPERKRTILEYIATTIGQCLQDLSKNEELKSVLLSHTAREAGLLMRTLRSKGLAHEILRFDSSQFLDDFEKVILPAKTDFCSIHMIQTASRRENKCPLALGIAYERLGWPDKANKHFLQAFDNIEGQIELLKSHWSEIMSKDFIEDELKLISDVHLLFVTVTFANSRLAQGYFKESLNAINKISTIVDHLENFHGFELNNLIASFHALHGLCLYHLDNTNHKMIFSTCIKALKTKCSINIKFEIIANITKKLLGLLKNSQLINIRFIKEIVRFLDLISSSEDILYSNRHELLLLKLKITHFQKNKNKIKKQCKNLKNFIKNYKHYLKNQLSDRCHFLLLELILFRIQANEDPCNLNKLLSKFDLEYKKISKYGLHNNLLVTQCAYKLFEFIPIFVIKNENKITTATLFKWLKKTKYYLNCSKFNQDIDLIKNLALSLVSYFLMYCKRGSQFKQGVLDIIKEFNLNILKITNLLKLEKNFRKFNECENKNAKKSISLFSKTLKYKKISEDSISGFSEIIKYDSFSDDLIEEISKFFTSSQKKGDFFPAITLIPRHPPKGISRTKKISRVRFHSKRSPKTE